MRGKIVVLDYGVGNVHSVCGALTFLGYRSLVTRSHSAIRSADALILPGVGAFGQAMENLQTYDLLGILNDEVCVRKKPILGICLGMQILGKSSQETSGCAGLGWIDFDVVAIPPAQGLKVPHVGWNTLKVNEQSPLFKGLERDSHFYFDHGFFADSSAGLTVASCEYGRTIPSAVVKDNVVGVQFHPEKSQRNGLKLFRNYFNSLGV